MSPTSPPTRLFRVRVTDRLAPTHFADVAVLATDEPGAEAAVRLHYDVEGYRLAVVGAFPTGCVALHPLEPARTQLAIRPRPHAAAFALAQAAAFAQAMATARATDEATEHAAEESRKLSSEKA